MDAALQVSAVVTTIPPRKSERGRSVDSLIIPLGVVAASPTLAIPTPVLVQMNCDTDSIVMFTIRTFYLMGATDSRRAVSCLFPVFEFDELNSDLATLDDFTTLDCEVVNCFIVWVYPSKLQSVEQWFDSVVDVKFSPVGSVQHDID